MAGTNRAAVRVGRSVVYRPTDAEASTGGDNAGATWKAWITRVLANGTVNLHVLEGDGTTIAKTGVSRGERKGEFQTIGLGPESP